jgi:peptide/nickel transport system permease protein
MRAYVVQRLSLALFLALGSASLVFFMINLAPGDVVLAALGDAGGLTAEQVRIKREDLGLDRPLLVQYVDWLGHVARGDLGASFVNGRSIARDISLSLPRTLELVVAALLVGLVLGIPAGVYSATRQDHWADHVLTGASLLAVSVPSFVSGTLLLLFFGLQLRWLPVSGFVSFAEGPWLHVRLLVLPAATLGLFMAALITRMTRATMLEVNRSDFVRTARSKGLPERLVLLRHALKNALIPVVSLIGLQMPLYLGGSVIIEAIFRLPGVGLFFFEALTRLDYPVVQSVNLIIAAMVVGLNLLIDLSYAFLDPRIRY